MVFRSRLFYVIALLLFSSWSPLLAIDPDWVVAVDVPTELGGTDRLPNEFLQTDGAMYTMLAMLPSGTEILPGALYR